MMPAVKVDGVGKFYRRYASRKDRLIEWVTNFKVARHEPRHWKDDFLPSSDL